MTKSPTPGPAGSRRTRIAVLLAVLGLLLGCSRGPSIPVARAPSKPFPSVAPAADQARVYFVRPPVKAGPGHYAVSVWVGDRLVAFVRHGQVAYVDLAPGKHLFLGLAQNADVLEVELAGGKMYYVHVRLVKYYMGGSGVFLDAIVPGHENWSKRKEWIAACKPVELNPPGAADWHARHAADNRTRMQRYASRPESEKKFVRPDQGD